MNRYLLEFQNRYLEKQYQKRVSDQSSRLLRRILVGYFVFYVVPEISEASYYQDYSNINLNDVLSIIGYILLSVCYIGLTKKKELYNYIILVAHIAILLTGMLGMIKHTKQKNEYVADDSENDKRSWILQNIFQYSAIQVGFHFIVSLISSSIKIALTSVTIVYATFMLYVVILVGEGNGTSRFSVVMIIFFAFIICQMYFIHYNHRMRRQNFLHQFNDKQFTNILKNGLNQNIFFVSYNQTLNNIDIWFSNKNCEKYFSSQNKGEFKKFTRSVYLQEQVSTQYEEFYPDGNGYNTKNKRMNERNTTANNGDITDEYDLAEKKRILKTKTKDKSTKLENVIIELIKAQIKKQKHKNYYDFSSFQKYLAIQKEEVVIISNKNGAHQNQGGQNQQNQSQQQNQNQPQQIQMKEKLFQFKINTFIRNSCFNSCIIFNEEEWDKYNVLYQQKCSIQLQKQQDFIQMLQPVIQKMEPYSYLHQTLASSINQGATLLNNMLLYNLIVSNKYDNKYITLPEHLTDFSLYNLLDFIRCSNQVFFPIKYEINNNSSTNSSTQDNIILHSNRGRVAQIIQNFILEINQLINVYRKNSKIDVININAEQIKGSNNSSNIIKFTVSFNLSAELFSTNNPSFAPYPIQRSSFYSQSQIASTPSAQQLDRSSVNNQPQIPIYIPVQPHNMSNQLNQQLAGDQAPSILFEQNEEEEDDDNSKSENEIQNNKMNNIEEGEQNNQSISFSEMTSGHIQRSKNGYTNRSNQTQLLQVDEEDKVDKKNIAQIQKQIDGQNITNISMKQKNQQQQQLSLPSDNVSHNDPLNQLLNDQQYNSDEQIHNFYSQKNEKTSTQIQKQYEKLNNPSINQILMNNKVQQKRGSNDNETSPKCQYHSFDSTAKFLPLNPSSQTDDKNENIKGQQQQQQFPSIISFNNSKSQKKVSSITQLPKASGNNNNNKSDLNNNNSYINMNQNDINNNIVKQQQQKTPGGSKFNSNNSLAIYKNQSTYQTNSSTISQNIFTNRDQTLLQNNIVIQNKDKYNNEQTHIVDDEESGLFFKIDQNNNKNKQQNDNFKNLNDIDQEDLEQMDIWENDNTNPNNNFNNINNPLNLLSYQFQNQVKTKHSNSNTPINDSKNEINHDFTLNQIQNNNNNKQINQNKYHQNHHHQHYHSVPLHKTLNDPQINSDQQKGTNNSNLVIASNNGIIIEDTFSFQSPSNRNISMKNIDSAPSLIQHLQSDLNKINSINNISQTQSNYNKQNQHSYNMNSSQTNMSNQFLNNDQNMFTYSFANPNIQSLKFEKKQSNSDKISKYASLSHLKQNSTHIQKEDIDNLIIFKDDEDSKHSSVGKLQNNNKNIEAIEILSKDDSEIRKKRNTSHFALSFPALPQNNHEIIKEINPSQNETTPPNQINQIINKQDENEIFEDDCDKIISQIKQNQIINKNNNSPPQKSFTHKLSEDSVQSKPYTPPHNKNNNNLQRNSIGQEINGKRNSSKGGLVEVSKIIRLNKNQNSQQNVSLSPNLTPKTTAQQQRDYQFTKSSASMNQIQSQLENSTNNMISGIQTKPNKKTQLVPKVSNQTSQIPSPHQQNNSKNTLNSQALQNNPQNAPSHGQINSQQAGQLIFQNNGQNSVHLQNMANIAINQQVTPLNLKYLYQDQLRIMKTFKPDQDLEYQRLNCLNLQVNAKLICALGPTNDIFVNDKNEFCFFLYQDMRILRSAEQQFQNNQYFSLINVNNENPFNYIQEQISLGKFPNYKSQTLLNISTAQKDLVLQNEINNNLSESQLSNLLTSQKQNEGIGVHQIDQSNFSPGKIFRNVKQNDSN